MRRLCLFCSDCRTSSASPLCYQGFIYPALNEIGLITELPFFLLSLKNLLLEMHFALNAED